MVVNSKNMVMTQIITRPASEQKVAGGRSNPSSESGQKEDARALERLRETVEEKPEKETLAEKLLGRTLRFEIDRELNQVVVKVIDKDKESGEVIRQIPPEEYIQILKRLQDMGGALLDREV
jgi:flagellar protein FlaG